MQTAIDFARDINLVALNAKLGSKCALRPTEQRGQHLAGLIIVAINGLLAENDQIGAFCLYHRFQHFGNAQRLKLIIGFDQNAAIGTHCQSGANGFLRLCRADRNNNNFVCGSRLLQAHRFFNGNLTKRVHRHFDIGQINARLVRFDANFDIIVNHAFDGDKDFHNGLSTIIARFFHSGHFWGFNYAFVRNKSIDQPLAPCVKTRLTICRLIAICAGHPFYVFFAIFIGCACRHEQ